MEENNITVDKAVQTIKGAILRAQAQASQSSNAIQLSLYYGIGRYVSINLQQAHWGAKALDTISERLQRELPGLRGFSSGNLKKMRIFYEEWQCLSIGSPLANQLQQLENKIEEGVEIGEKTLLCINERSVLQIVVNVYSHFIKYVRSKAIMFLLLFSFVQRVKRLIKVQSPQ